MRSLLLLSLFAAVALADGPKDNIPTAVRPIPPTDKAVALPEADKVSLTKELAELRTAIDAAVKAQAKNPRLEEFLPDLEIFHKATDWAGRYNEYFNKAEFKVAHDLIAEGKARAAAFQKGETPWTRQTGLVVRGYKSKIDGSVQPYGMVIPDNYAGSLMRLDFWCHGRGETLSELAFLKDRRANVGQIPATNRLVLHLYGRYCCANKFAGEVDLWEAYAHARKSYNIDDDRLFIRGFSMGGAAVWQFGAHYTDRWCAISPGAGFSETPEFLKVFQSEEVNRIPSWQKTLWSWYNATDVAVNFTNAPTIAYSGEIDGQKQAADIMARYLAKENIELTHIIGPKTAHKFHPDAFAEVERRLDIIAAAGRNRMPKEVSFVTYFLRYHRMHWVQVDRLETHWQPARVDAKVIDERHVIVQTKNVAALTLDMPAGFAPQSVRETTMVKIDGQDIEAVRATSERSWTAKFSRVNGKWALSAGPDESVLAKKHGLSGPVDDAFMDAFTFVAPTGPPLNAKVGGWVKSEMERAVFEWRRQFRGLAPVKNDAQVKDEDIAKSNLILWGDPSSNAVLAKIVAKLPITWTAEKLVVNGKTYAAGDHAPILIYPNPLNPQKYVVINSGFTYREYDYLNNARQIAKLPDWAVIDLNTAPDTQNPGKVEDAGFFDEVWQFRTSK
ncbi:MAG: prolyl oligopeptidase family serine peptidase [Opitutales bacterium]|nr:prolyl oligopeptidase family serine peptidase [Opitutales bacterium]